MRALAIFRMSDTAKNKEDTGLEEKDVAGAVHIRWWMPHLEKHAQAGRSGKEPNDFYKRSALVEGSKTTYMF